MNKSYQIILGSDNRLYFHVMANIGFRTATLRTDFINDLLITGEEK